MYYFIHPSKNKDKILKSVMEHLNIKAINLKEDGLDAEQWLYYLQHAKLVISDSFHASSFSIIFNKKFITLFDYYKDARYKTLEDITGLEYRFCKSIDFSLEFFQKNILKDESWADIERKLQPLKEFSINWLKNAINKNPNRKISKEQEILESFYTSLDDRLNYLEGKSVSFNSLAQRIQNLELQNNKNSILINYYKNKFLNLITKKEKYKQKRDYYHEQVRALRRIKQ